MYFLLMYILNLCVYYLFVEINIYLLFLSLCVYIFLPAHASEQGNVILSVRIRECGSTLYVGLARTAPPTNTNFRLTFLLTRLQEALYEDLAV